MAMELKLKTSLKEVLRTKNIASVKRMFDEIAPRYDLLNHLLSFNIDKYWRKKTTTELSYLKNKDAHILDVATGTGDLAKEILINIVPNKLIAVDISESMLNVAKKKLGALKTEALILLKLEAAEELNIATNSMDAVTIAFGVRNFNNLDKSLQNIYAILKPNAKLVILEFSKSKNTIVNFIYKYYFSCLLPFIGRLISGHNFAYNYLIDSVGDFPSRENFLLKMEQAGFYNTVYKPLTFGICTIYAGYKKPKVNA